MGRGSLRRSAGDAVRRFPADHWRRATAQHRNDACEGTSGRPPDRPQAKGSDPRANDGGPPSQPIRDRAQLALKHQAEWEELESIRADVVAALQGIRIQLQSSVSSASPDRQNRKSSTGTQNLPPGLGPRVTLDEHLKQATRWAGLYEKAASGLQKAQEGERRAYGFDYKMQQQQTAVDPVALQRRNEWIDEILDRMLNGPGRSNASTKNVKKPTLRRRTTTDGPPAGAAQRNTLLAGHKGSPSCCRAPASGCRRRRRESERSPA